VNPRISSLFSVSFLAFALVASVMAAPTASAKDEKLQEIQVTLFGQPCTMSGPYPKAALSLLHEISPEKLPPEITLEQMKRVRTKTGELKGMPMVVEQYRDHLRKRLSAKITFAEAVAQAKKSNAGRKSLDPFLTNIKENISVLDYPAFVDATKKAFEANGAIWNDTFIGPLRERYENAIQPDTEEEFHKAIRAAKIQYVCAFDDSDHRGSESEGSE
jgi:hypothetical protein